MSFKRPKRSRRDENEGGLIERAGALGAIFWPVNELVDLVMLWRGQWYLVEIKRPEKEGHADEYTARQKIFHQEVRHYGGRILVWRTESDVLRDLGGQRAA